MPSMEANPETGYGRLWISRVNRYCKWYLIQLMDKPAKEGWAFYCRKGFYAVSCIHSEWFRANQPCGIVACTGQLWIIVDNPGVWNWLAWEWADTTAFKKSDLGVKKGDYFEADEYILVDKGMTSSQQCQLLTTTIPGSPLTKHTIHPFSEHDLTNDPVEARKQHHWNWELSHLHVWVEHAFGVLKGHFHDCGGSESWFKAGLEVNWISPHPSQHPQEFGDDPFTIEGFYGSEEDDPVTPHVEEDV